MVVGRALGTVLMTVRGALGRAAAQELVASVEEVVGEQPQRVVIDLTGVTAIEDDGVEVLYEAKAAAEAHKVEFQVTAKSDQILTRLSDDFTVV